MPAVFLTLNKLNDWRGAVIELMLKAGDLIAPTNLIHAVVRTFTWHYRFVCDWAARQ